MLRSLEIVQLFVKYVISRILLFKQALVDAGCCFVNDWLLYAN